MIRSPIKVEEFRDRRERVLRSLKGAVGLVHSGSGAPPLRGGWEPMADFNYLTGIRDEAGAAVLFDATNPDPRRRIMLVLRPTDPELEQWDGFRDLISAKMKKATAFDSVIRTTALPRFVTAAAKRTKRLACLHQFAVYDSPVSADLAVFRKIAERVPGVAIEDRTDLLPQMRAVKSRAEQGLIRKAAEATRLGYEHAMGVIAPGVSEREVQRALEAGFVEGGGERTAYNSIVGAGANATVLHYMRNDAVLEDGQVLLIDAAAEVGGYASDVTRAFPVSGKFTKEQREIYDLVLKSLDAGIKAARPGATFVDVDMASREVIDRAGLGDTFVHGIGHHIGLEVHDPQTHGKLEAGMIFTIEPGVYLQDRALGIRIEDDILITRDGRKNLTSAIPRTADEVEAAMHAARRRAR